MPKMSYKCARPGGPLPNTCSNSDLIIIQIYNDKFSSLNKHCKKKKLYPT